jgi:hypothetical protein
VIVRPRDTANRPEVIGYFAGRMVTVSGSSHRFASAA